MKIDHECDNCGKAFTKIGHREHVKTCQILKYWRQFGICEYCGKTIKYRQNVPRHIQQFHPHH